MQIIQNLEKDGNESGDKVSGGPAHTRRPILTEFVMLGGPPDMFVNS